MATKIEIIHKTKSGKTIKLTKEEAKLLHEDLNEIFAKEKDPIVITYPYPYQYPIIWTYPYSCHTYFSNDISHPATTDNNCTTNMVVYNSNNTTQFSFT